MRRYYARDFPDLLYNVLVDEVPVPDALEVAWKDEDGGWGYVVALTDKDTDEQNQLVDGQFQTYTYRGFITFAEGTEVPVA